MQNFHVSMNGRVISYCTRAFSRGDAIAQARESRYARAMAAAFEAEGTELYFDAYEL